MQKVILHVGPPKTGTTSIQGFLHSVHDELLSHGILYPREGRLNAGTRYCIYRHGKPSMMSGPSDNHQLLAWAMKKEAEGVDADHCWLKVLQEIDAAKPKTVILSGEDFFGISPESIGQVKKYLENFSVKILFYLRNPFDLLLSGYKQRVKAGRFHRAFPAFLQEEGPIIFEAYETRAKSWSEIFGLENMIVKPFDRIKKIPGIERDLLEFLELNPKDFEQPLLQMKRLNVSPSDETIHLMRFWTFVERSLGSPKWLRVFFSKARGKSSVLSPPVKMIFVAGKPFLQKALFQNEDIRTIRNLTKEWGPRFFGTYLKPEDRPFVEF